METCCYVAEHTRISRSIPCPALFNVSEFSCDVCFQRLIVCLEESLYVHNIRDMKVLHTIRDTPPNPTGLCALSVNNDNCFLAYPGSNTIGEIQIFDCVNLVSQNFLSSVYLFQWVYISCLLHDLSSLFVLSEINTEFWAL